MWNAASEIVPRQKRDDRPGERNHLSSSLHRCSAIRIGPLPRMDGLPLSAIVREAEKFG
jgi:hypothetical protein